MAGIMKRKTTTTQIGDLQELHSYRSSSHQNPFSYSANADSPTSTSTAAAASTAASFRPNNPCVLEAEH